MTKRLASITVPDKPTLEGLEQKWAERWETDGTYRFDRTKERSEIYSIDTPPPTVSGSLHVGSVFSYTHTDTVARFQRMIGKSVFYPMGWDDNGLPTERRVQNEHGVRCDPSIPYDPTFKASELPKGSKNKGSNKDVISISRPNFVELCSSWTLEAEKEFEDLFRRLGLSVDWTMTYTTIGKESQRVSQRAFLRNLARGEAYQAEAPTLWDIDFQTAVAQAELEDRETTAAYHRVSFKRADGNGDVQIETTRPELIPAVVALVAHPDDERYKPLFDTEVLSPLFGARIPIKAHELADPEKGSGIAMICTFGDVTDVVWWRELGLPVRTILERNGRLKEIEWGTEPFSSDDATTAQKHYGELAGLTTKQAQKKIVEQLGAAGLLIGEPRPITHPVKYFEKGDRPLEIVTSRQWFIKTLEYREQFLKLGQELKWHPEFMRFRYESWVEGLNTDWLISRQRFFGVPFPVWYPVDSEKNVNRDEPILPDENDLPIDPSTDVPKGFTEDQRNKPGGFAGDPDVMDTWATSSLTPQIAGGWEDDNDLFKRVFPMDVRPQAHEIIRTWLFATVVRAELEHQQLPWDNAAISGFIVDPDRKKMSKSKDNAVTPMQLFDQYGSDAVRYWASNGRPGVDTTFDEGQIKIGRRLGIKILNASKFVLSRLGTEGEVTEPLDQSMLAALAELVEQSTKAFNEYDYARALERTETFFWNFCDDYLELVKIRAYGTHGDAPAASANTALTTALSVLLRLFAPFMPFVTEDVWKWWQEGSIHNQQWPNADELRKPAKGTSPKVLETTSSVLSEVRGAKSEAKASMKTPITRATVSRPSTDLENLQLAERDLKDAGVIEDLQLKESDTSAVNVELGEAK